MRTGITVNVTATDRERLLAILANCNSPQEHVWRANIILLVNRPAASVAATTSASSRVTPLL
jgi:hypothetical protein